MNEFIAWDKEDKRWVNPNDVYVNGNSIVYRIKYHSRPTPMDSVREYLKAEKVSIYPYIGRTDRDGKKVYEGSKLQIPGFNYVYVIEYRKETCSFIGKVINPENDVQKVLFSMLKLPLLDEGFGQIIGHIAEGSHE